MKNGNGASACPAVPGQRPYTVVGNDRLNSLVWKIGEERGGWRYRFNIFRSCSDTGQVDQRFEPQDLPHLAKLVQLLAVEIAIDGCLEAELRDDLNCLAACLDDVLSGGRETHLRWLALDGEIAEALYTVLEYLWDDERVSYKLCPSESHVFHSLSLVDRWLRGHASGCKSGAVTKRHSDEAAG